MSSTWASNMQIKIIRVLPFKSEIKLSHCCALFFKSLFELLRKLGIVVDWLFFYNCLRYLFPLGLSDIRVRITNFINKLFLSILSLFPNASKAHWPVFFSTMLWMSWNSIFTFHSTIRTSLYASNSCSSFLIKICADCFSNVILTDMIDI